MPINSAVSHGESPPHSNGQIHRKLYMPSHDLQFDLEMARRASTAKDDADSTQVAENSDQLTNADQLGNAQEKKPMKFGLIDFHHDEIDEHTLEQLAIPEPLSYHQGIERELRPSSIFIYNRSIALLKTEQIISHALHLLGDRSKTFSHLEWVDDFSCVLSFTTNVDAIEAFINLLIRPDEVEGENGLPEAFAYLLSEESTVEVYAAAYEFICTPRPAKPFSKTMFEVNPKNKLHQPTRAEQLIPFIRFATKFDVKGLSSRDKSLFYALNGVRAGQEGVLSKKADPNISCRTSFSSRENPLTHDRWARTALPEIRRSLHSANASSKRARPTTSSALDDELDRFMNNAGDTKPLQAEASHTKTKRAKKEVNDDDDDKTAAQKNHQVQGSLPKVPKPSIELLPDRPSTRGGNLKDELFSTAATDFEHEEVDKKSHLVTSQSNQDSFSGAERYQEINLKEEEILDEKFDTSMISRKDARRDAELMDLEEFYDDDQYN